MLTYGGDPAALSPGTTAFADAGSEDRVTYYLESDTAQGGDGACYVWGHDPSYYDGFGCTEL